MMIIVIQAIMDKTTENDPTATFEEDETLQPDAVGVTAHDAVRGTNLPARVILIFAYSPG
jgi:hypothetical protein